MYRAASLILLLILSIPWDLSAQNGGKARIKLVHANSLEFDRSMGEDARRLIGDVRFEHGKATMDCDSAYLYSDRQRLKAYGNVHIVHNDSIHLYGDSLHYSGEGRTARLRGNVKVRDPQMTLRTDTLVYDIPRSVARYRGGGRLEVHESQQKLKSKRGIYEADVQLMHFEKDVKLTHPEYQLYSDTLEYETATRIAHFLGPTVIRTEEETIYCEGGWYDLENDRSVLTQSPYIARDASIIKADTLRYAREGGAGEARGRVFLRNYEEDIRAFSGKGSFKREEAWVRLSKDPVVFRKFEKDTLYLRADTIRAQRDSATDERRLIAYPRVRFFRRDLQGKCDSLSYEGTDSTARLFREPVLWSGSDRIAGDTLLLRMDGEGVDRVEIPSRPFLSSRKADPFYDQMKGERMKAFFNDEDRIHRIEIRGKGKTLHFPEEEGSDEKMIGMNRTASARIDIRFEKGEMRSVRFKEEPSATLYPLKDLDEDMIHLEGFRWDEKGRSSAPADVLDGSWIEKEKGYRR